MTIQQVYSEKFYLVFSSLDKVLYSKFEYILILVDPHEHFSDIVKYGYSTLEEFISEIPVNVMTELIISRGIVANPGMNTSTQVDAVKYLSIRFKKIINKFLHFVLLSKLLHNLG